MPGWRCASPRNLIGRADDPPLPRPMPAAGFWPGEPAGNDRPNVAVIFYRALVAGADTSPIDALCAELDRRGFNPVGLYITSLKDERSAAFIRAAFAAHPPDVIINATAFATATAQGDGAVLAAYDCPVLQVALAGSSQAAWQSSSRGLTPRDLAMHVVLPEVDGRIFAHAIAFKEPGSMAGSLFAPTVLRAVPDRIAATAELAARWIVLRRSAVGTRRVAIVLANYPNRDGRLANGVGLDTPESLIDILAAMEQAGYDIGAAPRDSAAMMRLLQEGPTNQLADRNSRRGGVTWPVIGYERALAESPESVRQAVEQRWVIHGRIRTCRTMRFTSVCIGSAMS